MNTVSRITIAISLGVVLLAGTLTACSTTDTPVPSSFTITDQLGQNITINNTHPQRIISLAPSNTEILFALGLGDRIVGVSDYSDYPAEASTKKNIGAYDNPNIEEIVALEPDLILGTEAQSETIYQQLRNRGLTVVGIYPTSIDGILDSITLIGQITGQDKEAATLVTEMQKRINAIADKTSQLTDAQKPRVFYIIWSDPIWTAGKDTFADALIQIAGGVNIAGNLTGYVDMSLEAVIAANPQVIIAGIGMGDGEDLPLQFVLTDDRLSSTDARRNNRVDSVNMDLVSRPGPRIVDALEDLFELIHPELK
jgi:iron complex transport system substrate-binding protein